MCIRDSKIIESGSIKQVLTNPTNSYTKALINAISEPDPNNLYEEKKISV